MHHFKWAYEDFLKCVNQREVDLFCLRCSSVRFPVRHGQIWLLIWHRSPLFMSKCFDWPGSDKRHNLLTYSLALLVDCTLPLQHFCSKQINQRKKKKKEEGKMRSIHLSATFFTFCRPAQRSRWSAAARNNTLFMTGSPSHCCTATTHIATSGTLGCFPENGGKKWTLRRWAYVTLIAHRLFIVSS